MIFFSFLSPLGVMALQANDLSHGTNYDHNNMRAHQNNDTGEDSGQQQ